MVKPPETFCTARLFARKPSPKDAPAVFSAYASDPEATRYLSWKPYAAQEPLAEFLLGRQQDWELNRGHYVWLLSEREGGPPIGSIGVLFDGRKAVVGYVLGRPWWGRGYMSEALAFLVGWADAQPEIQRLWAFCDVDNPASARVMEKAGLVREAVLRRWHVCPNIGPDLRDCIVCARVK